MVFLDVRACSVPQRTGGKLPIWRHAVRLPDWSADCRYQADPTVRARHQGGDVRVEDGTRTFLGIDAYYEPRHVGGRLMTASMQPRQPHALQALPAAESLSLSLSLSSLDSQPNAHTADATS